MLVLLNASWLRHIRHNDLRPVGIVSNVHPLGPNLAFLFDLHPVGGIFPSVFPRQ